MTVASALGQHGDKLEQPRRRFQTEKAYYWRLRNTFLEFEVRTNDDSSDSESRGNSSGRSLSVDRGIAARRDPAPFVPSTVSPVAMGHQQGCRSRGRASSAVHNGQSFGVQQSEGSGRNQSRAEVSGPHHMPDTACTGDRCDAEAKDQNAESQVPGRAGDAEPTTVMIRNVACKFKEVDIKDILDQAGFAGTYNMISVPRKPTKSRPSNLGYVFVTFLSSDVVQECRRAFEGKCFGPSKSAKKVEVMLANSLTRSSSSTL